MLKLKLIDVINYKASIELVGRASKLLRRSTVIDSGKLLRRSNVVNSAVN